MLVAVIYEEEYQLYGQHHSRSIYAVVVKKSEESEEDFQSRIRDQMNRLKSIYSYYDFEIYEAE